MVQECYYGPNGYLCVPITYEVTYSPTYAESVLTGVTTQTFKTSTISYVPYGSTLFSSGQVTATVPASTILGLSETEFSALGVIVVVLLGLVVAWALIKQLRKRPQGA